MANKAFDTPEAAEAAFYEAFATSDLDLMTEIWANGDNALCIHPGSALLRGKTAVMQSWMEILSGRAPPAIEYHFLAGFATGNLAVRVVEERIWPRDKTAESASRVLATNVYLHKASSWRLAEHHASLPLVDRAEAASKDRQLH